MTEPPRRRILKWLGGTLGVALGAAASLPGLRLLARPLWDREREEPPSPVAKLGELPIGEPRRVAIVGTQRDAWLRVGPVKLGACWLVRQPEGGVLALSTVCPHLGCGIDWSRQSRRFECPCHGSAFDLGGRRTGGPSPRDMDPLEVRTAGSQVEVRYQRFRTGARKREPLT